MFEGGSFTGLHQDGDGTVDSGHSVIQGYNEVVMLTRLSEAKKLSACSILLAKDGKVTGSKIDGTVLLYTQPHEKNKKKKGPKGKECLWPTNKTIAKWAAAG